MLKTEKASAHNVQSPLTSKSFGTCADCVIPILLASFYRSYFLSTAAEEATLKSSGHRYNISEQQAIYSSEVERIWNAQRDSLSNPVPPELTAEDERRAERAKQLLQQKQVARERSQSVSGRAGSPGAASNVEGEAEGASGKVLKIRRLVSSLPRFCCYL